MPSSSQAPSRSAASNSHPIVPFVIPQEPAKSSPPLLHGHSFLIPESSPPFHSATTSCQNSFTRPDLGSSTLGLCTASVRPDEDEIEADGEEEGVGVGGEMGEFEEDEEFDASSSQEASTYHFFCLRIWYFFDDSSFFLSTNSCRPFRDHFRDVLLLKT
ncbi:unnamed protein product [Protopolystoma xenopodis]|uniref:Uncharacterized protein n=1 Tax=Protopolystoma xenopodis TaxID=117903 RepID=A0A3S5ADM8_9PLAT|nr:unnamed protein product [Protopolystoma xenopodis]